jgi:hypothetical protein
MPTQRQRVESGKRNYAGSGIEKRNTALSVASRTGAVRLADVEQERLARISSRVTTVLDYCTDAKVAGDHIDAGNEPYLLVRDVLNQGEYLTIPIYDRRIEAIEARTGLCWIHLSRGDALVKPDTLVYWK